MWRCWWTQLPMSTKDSGQAFFIPNGEKFMVSLSHACKELMSIRSFTAVFVGNADLFFASVCCLVVPTALADNALTSVMTVAIQDLVADLANYCQRTYASAGVISNGWSASILSPLQISSVKSSIIFSRPLKSCTQKYFPSLDIISKGFLQFQSTFTHVRYGFIVNLKPCGYFMLFLRKTESHVCRYATAFSIGTDQYLNIL